MCGLTGGVWTDPHLELTTDELEQMTSVLAHRGPDDQQTWFSAGPRARVGFGHRRLSIIDVDHSRQPISNEDRSITLIFNGEIYNYRELRAQLQADGHVLATAGDTETIVHLYEQHGVGCLQHLRGMFTFALWDESRQQLLLARDRLGQKPLYYRHEAGRLLFASELKSLLQVRNAPRDVSPRALDLYLTYQYVPHPSCILDGYNQLPPGHAAVWKDGDLNVQAYWSPPFDHCDVRPREEWMSTLRETMTEAVRLRMRSDVPLGAFLSGGVDSTIITGLMAQLSGQPVKTFSIGFGEQRFDERSYAREAAKLHRTEHTELVVEPSAVDILPQLVWHYDEPFSDSSAIPTMYLSRLARQQVKVALSGDGGDELFLGYDRYRAVRIASLADRLGPLRRIFGVGKLVPGSVRHRSFRRRLKRWLEGLTQNPRERYFNWIAIFNSARREALYRHEFRDQLSGDASKFLFDTYDTVGDRDFVSQTSFVDILTYLPCDILTKVDRASMSCGLEARSPMLDHEVVALAVSMPRDIKQSLRDGKCILRETFAHLLPESVQKRPKMGFGVPIDVWFRGELKEMLHDVLLDSRSSDRGWFDPSVVRELIESHTSGRADHAYRLWSLLILELWSRTFLDGGMINPP